MLLKDLQEIVNRAVADGHGNVPVRFDAEARAFHIHMVDIDLAGMEDYENGKHADPEFILTTRYHLYPNIINVCDCQKCDAALTAVAHK